MDVPYEYWSLMLVQGSANNEHMAYGGSVLVTTPAVVMVHGI